MPHNIAFTKVVEYEYRGRRYRKVTAAEAKQFDGAVRDTYETTPGVPSFGWFVPVDAKPKADAPENDMRNVPIEEEKRR